MSETLRPWLGLASFTEAHAAQFFGREAEVTELVRRLSRKGLTVLFGQSGLGKTSILQAGIVPRMREAGFAPVLLRIDYAAEAPTPESQVLSALGWAQDASLWEHLHRRDRQGPAPLLVFDQFEEVFTLGQADDAGRAKARDFLAALADLAENRVPAALEARLDTDDTLFERYDLQRADFRLLISLREDYLAHLEPLKAAMPSITQNRMRIAPMSGEQALQAVCGPGGELVSTDTAEAIVRFVSGTRSVEHAEVEPALLSLILRELNEQRIAKGQAQITPDLLAGSHAAILSDFYERSLADQPVGVRHFIEDQLLTDTGYRENVAEERVKQAFAAAGAAPDALERLINQRLLRVEERLDRRRVELTHDTLCAVVSSSRENRQERERAEVAERQAAEQRAEAQARAEQARVARQALRRSRALVAGVSVLAVCAVLGGAFAYHSAQRAQQSEQEAQTSRAQAQAVMGYLLDDFYRELEPAGKLDLVRQLAEKVVAYYDALPPRLQSTETQRLKALAQMQLGWAWLFAINTDQAGPHLEAARASLTQLRAAGDRTEGTAAALSQVLEGLAYRKQILAQPESALVLAREAREVLNEWIGRGSLRTHSRAAWAAFREGLNTRDTAQSIKILQDGVEITNRAGGERLVSGGLAALPVKDQVELATARAALLLWVGFNEMGRDNFEAARQRIEDVRTLADWSLARVPDNRSIELSVAFTSSIAAGLADAASDDQAVLRLARESVQVWRTLAERDRSNGLVAGNVLGAEKRLAGKLEDLGRYGEAMAIMREGVQLPRTEMSQARLQLGLTTLYADMMTLQWRAGARSDLRETLQRWQQAVESAQRAGEQQPPIFARWALESAYWRYRAADPAIASTELAALRAAVAKARGPETAQGLHGGNNNRRALVMARWALAAGDAQAGNWSQARAELDDLIPATSSAEFSDSWGSRWEMRAHALHWQALSLWQTGDLPTARQRAQEAAALIAARGRSPSSLITRLLKAQAADLAAALAAPGAAPRAGLSTLPTAERARSEAQEWLRAWAAAKPVVAAAP